MKKIKVLFISCLMMFSFAIGAQAADMNMYVNGIFVVRDLETVGEFDMLPILDIAGELGYQCTFDGTTAILYNDWQSYTFVVGSATVIDRYGGWYGLDVVPQIKNDKLYVPAKFFQDAMGLSYTWDSVTNTIFLNSDATYQWLINTPEHKQANPKYMAGLYARSLWNTGTITSYGGEMVQYNCVAYPVTELWYYMADVNYDGVLDLVISESDYQGNGIIVYTYRDGSIQPIYSPGMPYSSGVEILTLATYEGRYGIFQHRQNSADNFNFYHLSYYGEKNPVLSGYHMEDDYNILWVINDINIGRTIWYDRFNAIQPVQFYSLWSLESMAY